MSNVRASSWGLLCLFLFSAAWSATAANSDNRISFFQDSTFQVDGRVVKLLGGSTWLLDRETLLLPIQDVIVVFPEPDSTEGETDIEKRIQNLPKRGAFYIEGEFVGAQLIKGIYLRTNGKLLTVVEEMGDGAVLRTDDGSLWSVPEYDQYDTGYWLPPYKVIVTSSELYMYNLKKGKRIWVTKIER